MEEYKELQEHFDDLLDFMQTCSDMSISLCYDEDFVLYNNDTGNRDKIYTLLGVLYKVIYSYYKRDKIAYLDKDYFLERLVQQVSFKLTEYSVKYNVNDILSKFDNKENYDNTSLVKSKSKERGVSGSTVVQSTASTPTGVNNSSTGHLLEVNKTVDETGAEVRFEDDSYTNKYTNFQGKTNGVHDNDVNRDSDITRKGKYLDIIELQNRLPQSLYDELLKDVVYNFIFIY